MSVTSAKSALQLAVVGVLLDELFDALAADFLFALKHHANIDRQLAAAGLEQRLEGLHLHPELALVVDRAARVDVLIALGWAPLQSCFAACCLSPLTATGVLVDERRRLPLVQRLGRLHIEVRIAQRSRLAGGMQPVGVNQRMSLGGDDLDILEADALQIGSDHLGGLADISFVLFGRC